MSDTKEATGRRPISTVPSGHVEAQGSLSGVDDVQIYADIADELLSQTTHPLIVADVTRWPRDGHTIVIVRASQDKDGTRLREALSTQIETWEAEAAA